MKPGLRRAKLGAEDGVGLIELLIALTLLAIGIGATIATLSSSIVVLQHASKEGTAITLADRQLEAYRAMPFACVPRSSSMVQPAACPVTPTYSGFPQPYSGSTPYTQTVSGSDAPDHRSYVVTTTVSSSATEPQITVTVALTGAASTVLAQESSYFSDAGTTPTAN
jgi:type II secretory pathway pseudopilin PulG